MARLKNITQRKDGRWVYSKTINGIRTYIYAKTQKELLKKLKTEKPVIPSIKPKEALEYINEWCKTYKSNIASYDKYLSIIRNYFNITLFKQPIQNLNYENLTNFLNNIPGNRTRAYCYFVLKGTLTEAYKCKYIKENISLLLNKPKVKNKIGENFNLKEQKAILENLDKSNMKYEILFYLLTGCRRNEATSLTEENINYENLTIHIKGTKTSHSNRYIPISEEFAEILKQNFKNMFTNAFGWYSKAFQKYLKTLNISNHKLHDLRHTYSTNLHYLGVPDKERQYFLGHSSIMITNDIYTHLDLNVKKEHILSLYKDLYPKF